MDNTPYSIIKQHDSVDEQIALLIKELSLEAHIEGGYYRRTYESPQTINTAHGQRFAATAIHYLLTYGHHSKWHRLRSNEHWFHHFGETILLHTLSEPGQLQTQRLGSIESNALPAVSIPPNTWFAAELEANTSYAFVSCMVHPGFDFDDFELAETAALLESFPQHAQLITKLS